MAYPFPIYTLLRFRLVGVHCGSIHYTQGAKL
jgi:hypothetical protein